MRARSCWTTAEGEIIDADIPADMYCRRRDRGTLEERRGRRRVSDPAKIVSLCLLWRSGGTS